MNQQSDTHRRRSILRGVMKLLFSLGVVLGLWVSVSFLGTPDNTSRIDTVSRVAVDKTTEGEVMFVEWNQRPVLILKRSVEMLESLRAINTKKLRDADSNDSMQPASMKNNFRATTPKIFIAIASGTDFGCPVEFLPADAELFLNEPWRGGFRDTCRGSRYDLAGRVYRDQHAAKNLAVPSYRIEGKTVVLGAE